MLYIYIHIQRSKQNIYFKMNDIIFIPQTYNEDYVYI